MNIVPWRHRSSTGLSSLRKDMDDLWSRFFDDDGGTPFTHLPEVFTRGIPSVNITENESTITFAVDLPGVEQKDVHVEILGDELLISGERRWESKEEEGKCVRMESQFGSFRRVLPLPSGLLTEPRDIDARYKDGILTIRLKKQEPTPSQSIEVKPG